MMTDQHVSVCGYAAQVDCGNLESHGLHFFGLVLEHKVAYLGLTFFPSETP